MESASSTSSQYLSLLLSQRDHDELPYNEAVKPLIQHHLLTLMQNLPSLLVRPAPFFNNDGKTVQLLQAEGTLPMSFNGSSYNVPVTIWLHEDYPIASPHVFVSPTSDMVIKRHHKHVNRSGMVSLPYLDKWVYPESNLIDLAHSLSAMFGLDPPLFSKSSSRTEVASPVNDYTSSSSQPENTTRSRNENSRSDDPSMVFRQNAINALTERIKLSVSELQRMHEADMDKLAVTRSQLTEKNKQLKAAVDRMLREKDGLEQQLQIIHMNTDVVGEWVRNQSKVEGLINIDDVFAPCDALSKQMLDCSSADLAVEDLLYSLDKAVQEGCLTMDAYLRQVRSLAREQFLYRFTCTKVQEVERQMRVSSMAARFVP